MPLPTDLKSVVHPLYWRLATVKRCPQLSVSGCQLGKHAAEILEPSWFESADYVIRKVKRKEEDREQRRNG